MTEATLRNIHFYDEFARYYCEVYRFLDAEATVSQWVELFEREGLVPPLERRLESRPHLLDAACGPGWFLVAWAQAGFDVDGLDASVCMQLLAIEEWRRRFPDKPHPVSFGCLGFENGTPLFLLKPMDVVVCHSHLPNLIHPADLPLFFQDLIAYLRPGGLLAFDHSRIVSSTPEGSEEHPLPSGGVLVRTSRYDPATRTCVQRWEGDSFSGEETYWFHDPADLDKMAENHGARLWKRLEWRPNQPDQPFHPATATSERLVSLYRRI